MLIYSYIKNGDNITIKKIITAVKILVFVCAILITTIVPNSVITNMVSVHAATKQPSLKPIPKELVVGETFQIQIKNPDKNKWKYSVSNTYYATVNSKGVIKAKNPGIISVKITNKKKIFRSIISIVSGFDTNKAREAITISQVSSTGNLYRVTSTYKLPTMLTMKFTILDSNDVTIEKSYMHVLVTPWGDSYLKYPLLKDDQKIVTTFEYTDASQRMNKDTYDSIMNSIKIINFEDTTVYVGKDINTWRFGYEVYIQNTSDKQVSTCIGLIACDETGNPLPYQNWNSTRLELEAGETIKHSIIIFQEMKNPDNAQIDNIKIGSFKFYIEDFN